MLEAGNKEISKLNDFIYILSNSFPYTSSSLSILISVYNGSQNGSYLMYIP